MHMQTQLHLNLFIYARGHHEAAWRHPKATPRPIMDIHHIVDCTRIAEKAHFDSIFLADVLHIPEDIEHSARIWLEPVTTLGALALATSHIGLIGTASTSYSEPFNLARQFASLDHISSGRAGWNIVTTFSAAGGRNFEAADDRMKHADRYEKGEEFVRVVKALWDSWSDDAIVDDRAGGRFARPDRIRAIDHHGAHYHVAGPLNLPRPPQGWPVLVQAGSSDTGRAFAARHAETIFTAHAQKGTAQDFYRDIKARATAVGRRPDQVLVLPGISAMIAGTEAEARRLDDELNNLTDPEIGRMRLSDRFDGADLSHLPLDTPLAPEDLPDPASNEASRGRTELIVGIVRRERPTLRQLLAKLSGARGHFTVVGTPEQVADAMIDWLDSGAADGFNVMPPILPHMLEVFTGEVVPILKRRGRFRTDYTGTTLREHLGLERPSA
ncbi:MAG: LLM class flavin-dependent oxidoreductase [Hyphomicrobiaceae bacterium]